MGILFQKHFNRIRELGAEIQINAWSFCEEQKENTVAAARFLLANQLTEYLGSDAHGEHHRPPKLAKGVKWIYDHCPEMYADAVVHDNAAKILNTVPCLAERRYDMILKQSGRIPCLKNTDYDGHRERRSKVFSGAAGQAGTERN